MFRLAVRVFHGLVLTLLSLAAVVTGLAVLYTSYAQRGSLSFSSDPVADDLNAGLYAYGFRCELRNWPDYLGDVWQGRAALAVWYKVSWDARERLWSLTVAPVSFEYDSRREYSSGCFVVSRVHR